MVGLNDVILVVEDEVNSRTLIAKILERAGYKVQSTESGQDALNYVKKQIPRVIILDLMMPGVSGLEVLEKLKADAKTARIPILVLTGKGEAEYVKKAITLGVDDYIVKPFQPNELLGRVRVHTFQLRSSELRDILPLLRIHDRALAAQIAKQVEMPMECQAFPIVYQDIHLCVMLPAGTSPESLKNLSDADISSLITIFILHKGSWKKLDAAG